MHEKMEITTSHITLGQFLNLANILESGGMAKVFLQNEAVLVNGEREDRRGRKLYPDDVVVVGADSFIVTKRKE